MEEFDREKEIERLLERKDTLRLLLDSSGWKDYSSVLSEQIETRTNSVLALDIEKADDAFEVVRLNAERRALMLALELPKIHLEMLTEEIEYYGRDDGSD